MYFFGKIFWTIVFQQDCFDEIVLTTFYPQDFLDEIFWMQGILVYGNFITAIYQNIPEIFGLCVFWAKYFITAIFML